LFINLRQEVDDDKQASPFLIFHLFSY